MATLCEMMVFSASLKSCNSVGLSTFGSGVGISFGSGTIVSFCAVDDGILTSTMASSNGFE